MLTHGVGVEQFSGDREAMVTIAELHLQVRRWQIAQGQGEFLGGLYSSQDDLSNIDTYYIKPSGNFWIAQEVGNSSVVGFVGLKRESEEEAKLKRLAVLPDYHKRGIGTLLVGAVVGWAQEMGLARIDLATGRRELARPLYEKFGFSIVGVDEPNDDYFMRLEIEQ